MEVFSPAPWCHQHRQRPSCGYGYYPPSPEGRQKKNWRTSVPGLSVLHHLFCIIWHQREGRRYVSLRSKPGTVDVSAIATRYGGGGHINAAGFSVPLHSEEADVLHPIRGSRCTDAFCRLPGRSCMGNDQESLTISGLRCLRVPVVFPLRLRFVQRGEGESLTVPPGASRAGDSTPPSLPLQRGGDSDHSAAVARASGPALPDKGEG